MKKRFFAFCVLLTLVFSLSIALISCGDEYEPVESTKEEKETVMTISYDGEKYKIPYELYRALFLELKSSVDSGDDTVWTGEKKDTYVKKIDELILHRICEIYSVIHLCDKAGIDVYSRDFDDKVTEYIKTVVDTESKYGGFDGDYDKYLNSLKEINMNYSVADLLLRYAFGREALELHYIGNIGDDLSSDAALGEIKYTRDAVKNFYFNNDDSRQIISLMLQKSTTSFDYDRAVEIRNTLASKSDAKSAGLYVAGFTGNPGSVVIGKYSYDKFYWSKYTDAAFSLEVGGTSQVITLKTDDFDGFAIIYRISPSEEYFNANYEEIANEYVRNEFGKLVEKASDGIKAGVEYTDALTNLDRSKVSIE